MKSVSPRLRLVLADRSHPRYWKQPKAQPTRRVWIAKPRKREKRPLGIPTMLMRAQQALGKMALEPEWEARFKPNRYGFRPGRSCHDAIEASLNALRYKPKYVFDADISGCFDKISHEWLLAHIPMDKNILAKWLKAGFIEKQVLHPTEEGTPQGGICSPVIANLALDGLERKLLERYPKPKTGYKERYFKSTKGNNWVFYGGIATKEGFVENYLLHPAHVPIKRHVKIKGEANPYDPAWEEYFEKCLGVKMVHHLKGKRQLIALWKQQKGLCPICQQKITKLTGWHNHHLVWRVNGGKDSADNRVLLHPHCHRQVHSKRLEVVKPRPARGERKA